MPIRASLHFHMNTKVHTIQTCHCVNAHSGFSSFPLDGAELMTVDLQVSMPIRASLHFHFHNYCCGNFSRWRCQCPFGLLFISTLQPKSECGVISSRVNAHSGFSSFPQHPSESRRNKAFSRPFLQVFIWKFWKQEFSKPFLSCSQFVHILQYCRTQSRLFLQYYILSKRSLTVVYYTTVFYSEKEHFVKSQ